MKNSNRCNDGPKPLNVAVILAGGSGTRLGGELPKQFLELRGKTILEYSIEAYEINTHIDEIAVVVKEEFIGDVRQIVSANGYTKVKHILCGGKERYHSSLAAVAVYEDDNTQMLFHDAVRPLVSQRIIDDCIEALKKYDAVDVGTKASDTIIQTDENNCIVSVPNRAVLRHGQTPQCFKRGIIRRAYELALSDPSFRTTDDCGTVLRYLPDIPIYVVEGEVRNMKVTYKDDIKLIESFLV